MGDDVLGVRTGPATVPAIAADPPGGSHQAGQQGYEGQPGNQGGPQHNP